jgi:hypothetical protein
LAAAVEASEAVKLTGLDKTGHGRLIPRFPLRWPHRLLRGFVGMKPLNGYSADGYASDECDSYLRADGSASA